MVIIKGMRQKSCEDPKSGQASCAKDGNNREIKLMKGIEYILILTDQHQNKCAGESRNDHGTYGQHAREKDNPKGCWCLRRTDSRQEVSYARSRHEGHDSACVPCFYFTQNYG